MKTTEAVSARRLKLVVNCGLIVIAAVSGLALGFVWRGQVHPVSANHSPEAAIASPGAAFSNMARVGFSPSSTTGEAAPEPDDSPLATRLERDVSMSSGVTRWLYWLEAVEKANVSDFPRLARMASGNSILARLVAARWVELDPRHMFDTLVADGRSGVGRLSGEFSGILLSEWPKRDPDGVITALSEDSGFGGLNSWRMRVASNFFDHDPERGLRLMHEWHIENYGPNTGGISKWTAANPRHAAEFTLAHPAGFASQRTMEAIGKEWAKSDPAGALAFAVSQTGELPTVLANAALKEWAGRNLSAAGEWLVSLDPQTRNRLSPVLVEAWAKQDAGSALAWCQENLTGSTLAQAVAGVVKGAAVKDVTAAAELVSAMHPSQGRGEAAVAVAEKWFPNSFANKLVPPEAIAWLRSLDSASVKHVLNQTSWRWTGSDPESMAEFLAAADPAAVPEHAYSNLARSMSRRNPEEAIEWAGRLPEERRQSVASHAFNEWWQAQPAAAMQWRNNLPDSDPRREQFFQNAIHSLAHHAQATDKLAALHDSDRAHARRIIESMPLQEERRAILLQALQRP